MKPNTLCYLKSSRDLPAELAEIVAEVKECGFYVTTFANFAPDIKDTTELMYVANLWAARANLCVAFNFDKKLCVFEVREPFVKN